MKKTIPQEVLKIIACLTMFLDHIGATLVPWMGLRVIGRLAFPIYCFLLVEGMTFTRNHKKYAIRLLIGALLAEIPFDLLFFGKLTLTHQSVMVTLLLGFLMMMWAAKSGRILLPLAVCFFAAELLGTDYGGYGVALIALFFMTTAKFHATALQTVGMFLLMLIMGSARIPVFGIRIPIQLFAVLSVIPISMYNARKLTRNIWVQRAFYLFYPVHLAVLLLIVTLQ